jgi:hypothetical protein
MLRALQLLIHGYGLNLDAYRFSAHCWHNKEQTIHSYTRTAYAHSKFLFSEANFHQYKTYFLSFLHIQHLIQLTDTAKQSKSQVKYSKQPKVAHLNDTF